MYHFIKKEQADFYSEIIQKMKKLPKTEWDVTLNMIYTQTSPETFFELCLANFYHNVDAPLESIADVIPYMEKAVAASRASLLLSSTLKRIKEEIKMIPAGYRYTKEGEISKEVFSTEEYYGNGFLTGFTMFVSGEKARELYKMEQFVQQNERDFAPKKF